MVCVCVCVDDSDPVNSTVQYRQTSSSSTREGNSVSKSEMLALFAVFTYFPPQPRSFRSLAWLPTPSRRRYASGRCTAPHCTRVRNFSPSLRLQLLATSQPPSQRIDDAAASSPATNPPVEGAVLDATMASKSWFVMRDRFLRMLAGWLAAAAAAA